MSLRFDVRNVREYENKNESEQAQKYRQMLDKIENRNVIGWDYFKQNHNEVLHIYIYILINVSIIMFSKAAILISSIFAFKSGNEDHSIQEICAEDYLVIVAVLDFSAPKNAVNLSKSKLIYINSVPAVAR